MKLIKVVKADAESPATVLSKLETVSYAVVTVPPTASVPRQRIYRVGVNPMSNIDKKEYRVILNGKASPVSKQEALELLKTAIGAGYKITYEK